MVEKQFKNSLQKIISVSFFFLLIIVFLVVCYTMMTIAQPLLIKNQQERVEFLGDQIVAQLRNSIVKTETIAASIANVYTGMTVKDSVVIKHLIPDLIDLPGTAKVIAGGGVWPEPFMFSKDRERRSFFWGRKADKQLHYFDDYNIASGAGYFHEKWYVPARYAESQKGIWSESYVDPYSLQSMVTCTVPMIEKGKFVGVSTVDLKLEGLAELFAEAGREVDGYLFAVDNSNKFLAFPDSGMIRQAGDHGEINPALEFIDCDALAQKDRRFATVCGVIAEIDNHYIMDAKKRSSEYDELVKALVRESYQINISQARLIAAHLNDSFSDKGTASQKLISFKVADDLLLHESVTVTIFRIPAADWKLAVVVPDSRVDVIVSQIMDELIFFLAVSLLAILFLAFFLLRLNLLVPLRKIISQLKRVEEDPHRNYMEIEISSNNELGKLAYHFNQRTRELESNRKRYKSLFDNAKDAIFIHDLETSILDVNQTMLEMYQIPDHATACSLSLADLSAPENDGVKAAELIKNALSGQPQEFEWRARRYRSGEIFDVLVNLFRSTFADKPVVVATVTDITEKLRNERELQKVSQLESLGLLAGGIAHDFNNLLSGIFGNISLARMQISSSSKVSKYLDKAEASLQRTTALTKQLLTFAKGGDPLRQVVDLNRLVAESSDFAVHGSNVKLDFEQSPNLWPVFADEGQIGQVISNLVINADQAMPEGGVITIAMSNFEEELIPDSNVEPTRYVRITVTDQGEGISQEDMVKIFDPYFTTKLTGCGLGLSLCFSIIKKHSGSIRVNSELATGTTFTIDLPAATVTDTGVGTEKDFVTVDEKSDNSALQRILVMDDDLVLQEVVAEILLSLGHSAVVVSDGQEALTVYSEALKNEQKFDFVILDLTIPGGMGGLETFEKMKELNPSVKAIVSSGYSTDPIMANYSEYGFAGCIPKPFSIDGVKACIDMVVS